MEEEFRPQMKKMAVAMGASLTEQDIDRMPPGMTSQGDTLCVCVCVCVCKRELLRWQSLINSDRYDELRVRHDDELTCLTSSSVILCRNLPLQPVSGVHEAVQDLRAARGGHQEGLQDARQRWQRLHRVE